MIEIIPNWHPIFVHFTVALLSISVALHLAVLVFREANWRGAALTVARWNLGLGIAFALLTLASGYYAFFTVDHDDPAHLAMKIHRNWALATFAIFGFLGVWHWFELRGQENVKQTFTALMVLGGLLLAITAWRGGGLVYEHGLGVQSLPEVSGEGHDHGDGGHDEAPPEAISSVGHDHGDDQEHEMAMASDGPAGAINAFHMALSSGDKEAVLAALAAEAVIYESGFVEASRDAYASHHMGSDMAFLQAMETTVTAQTVHAMGDMAMVLTESRLTGTYKEKAVDRISLETAILHKAGDGWEIIHLHWGGRAAGEDH